ncbi:MAG: tetratricopeptide repeat protein [Desulfobacteraceae bacterium]|nr:tetratricopeptide repeat protein [Desulfobacteraceae bacterium]
MFIFDITVKRFCKSFPNDLVKRFCKSFVLVPMLRVGMQGVALRADIPKAKFVRQISVPQLMDTPFPNDLKSRSTLKAIIFLLFTALFPVCLYGTETSSLAPEEQKALYNAQESIKKKNFKQARQQLLDHLKKHPAKPNPLVFYALGNTWYLEGNLKKASEVYEKGHALHPDSFLLCTNLAVVSYEIGNYIKAGQMFEKAYKLGNPRDAEYLWQAGTAYYKAKNLKKAKSVLKQIMQTRADIKKNRVKLFIQVCLELKDWKEAEKLVTDFLNKYPDDSEYWKLLSHIRLKRGDYRGAAGILEILYKIRVPEQNELEELANLYFYLNFPLKGIQCLEKAYGSTPDPEQCEKISKAYIQAQQLDKAVIYLDMAIKQGRSYERLLEKGKLYYKWGRWDDAVKSLRECIRARPDSEFAHLLLGYCALEKEDFILARKSLLKVSKGTKYRNEASSALRMLNDIASEVRTAQ